LHKVVHRDLKPSNILISDDGQPHILDFGLANIEIPQGDQEATLSLLVELMGTPAYMSPEQTERDPSNIDARSDVYSLGVILYRLLTGKYPYNVRGRLDEVVHEIATTDPTPPSRLSQVIDNKTEAIVLKALSKDPNERYATAGDMAKDLRRRLAGEPVEAKLISRNHMFTRAIHRYRKRLVASCVVAATFVAAILITKSLIRPSVDEVTLKPNKMKVLLTPNEMELKESEPTRVDSEELAKSVKLADQPKKVEQVDEGKDLQPPSPKTLQAPEAKIKVLALQLEEAIKQKDWKMALGYLENIKKDSSIDRVPELKNKLPTLEEQIKQELETSVSKMARETDEIRAKALIYQLEGNLASNKWQDALLNVEKLKKDYADTNIFRNSADKLVGWQKQIKDGLKALTAAEKREVKKILSKLELLIYSKNYIRGYWVLENLQTRFAQSDVLGEFAGKLDIFSTLIQKEIDSRNLVIKNHYMLNPSPAVTDQWQKSVSDAQQLLSNETIYSKDMVKRGLVLLRFIMENEEAEPMFSVRGKGVTFWSCCWGSSTLRRLSSGDIIIASMRRSSSSDGSYAIQVESVYHYSPMINLEFKEGQAIVSGEIIVESIPIEETGTLAVTVEFEDGLFIDKGNLEVGRSSPTRGISRPIGRDGRCVLSQISPGKYAIRAEKKDVFRSLIKRVEVKTGEVTEVELMAYRCRLVEFEWYFRRSRKSKSWTKGMSKVLSGDDWRPYNELGIRYSILEFYDRGPKECYLTRPSSNINIIQTDNKMFRKRSLFPTEEEFKHAKGRSFTIQEGDVFALQRDSSSESWQALIRIRKIAPVKVSTRAKSRRR
ncbi:MAG: serine/threonine protein kinase, partial [Planctomycetota bacterium]